VPTAAPTSLSLLESRNSTQSKVSPTSQNVASLVANHENGREITAVNGKCLLLPARSVARKLKYLLSHVKADLFIAAIASIRLKQPEVNDRFKYQQSSH